MAAKVLSFAKPNPANLMSPPPPQSLPPKKEVALALLERSSVHVYLDPRSKNVIVPAGLAKQPRLVLEIGLNMPVPIPDLRLDDEGMTCTLSFSRTPFFCAVPWTSVFAMVGDDGRGMVWPADVPPELANEGAARTLQAVPPQPPSAPAKKGEVAVAAESAKPAAKPKRARKKAGAAVDATAVVKEEAAKVEAPARPAPVAVPARAPAPRAVPQPAIAASPAPAPKAPAAPSSPHAPSAIKRPGAGKPKRELPPYLRVVK